ncbi:Disease resistance-like protein CSA1 [Cardamine amara subsp. amara]|uniref:ADP-ribosyl cyclase/cyclic ADP-ribose hydrolase n=1 Tax=Cardamine amara subsp. amara TaxID=228776 RepID=A0ABD1C0M9_CARAN
MATQEEALPQDPQVFINYRGAELRYGFFSHLERALKRNGVNVYGDQELMLGAPLGNIFKVIEESRMAIVIFSSRYTESRWCLEELVRIKELVEEGKLVVIPVFYKLMVSEVKDLKGEFGEHFRDLAKGTSGDQIKKWKKVLDFVSQRMGLVFNEKSDEFSFINSIVTEVKIIEKSLDRLSEQQDDVFMDYPSSEDLKGLDGGRDGILWDKKSDRNPKEAEIVQPEGKSRRDDGLNPSKNDNVLKKKVDSVIEETKKDNLSESSTMVTYDKLLSEHPEVFINFHGADLCHGFVDHVAKALERDGVNVYIDVDELPHEDLTELLFKRIEESRIALVIFSQRYTESRWFLNKLVKIKEFMDEGNILVIPIFYKVEPFEVTQLKGDLGVKFWNLWRINRDHHIIKWKEAVESVASMVGIYSEENSSESDFITVTVKKVLERISLQRAINTEFPTRKGEKHETYLNKNPLFGMELRMERLEKKLEFDCNETQIVGVVGMPGIGKTTLAMMLYDKWNCKFLRCVPLLGIRKKAEDYGTVWLRKTLLEVLLEGKFPVISDKTTHESVKDTLLQTKAFVILDDVSNKKQLEFLLGDLDWIKKGSKIVITTCDKSLLEGFPHDTYEVPELNDREAFQLFSYHAFGDKTCSPVGAFLTLSRMFVAYARGHPLALSLLGRELHGKDKGHWEYILEAVKKNSNMLFQDVWRFFTDQLNERQKDVFLDIVCFFKSEDEYFVRSLLDSQNSDSTNAVSEVKDLIKKFLITISDGQVEMNDLLYALGKDIGSRRWLRMWNYKDIISKLKKMELSDAHYVRGIFLDMSKLTKSIYLDSSTFIDMRNLRYLKIYDSCCPRQCKANGKLCFSDGLEFPLEDVQYLHWLKFPLKELPTDFIPRNLVDLRLPHSKIERVWEGVKDTPQLKWVDLSHSSNLLDLSALSRAENLQRLNLEGCKILDKLPVEIQNMKSLVFMNMRGCTRLSYLPEMNLISLKTLILSDCLNLEKFQLISENLEVLLLDGTAIKGLPPAIKKLQRLVVLNLKNCKMLECLPNCLRELKALEELILSGCSRLKNLSVVRENMKHLQSLLIDRIGAKVMPNISCATISEGQASADMVFLQTLGPREWPRGVTEVSSLRRLCLSGNDFVSLQTDIGKLYNLNWLDVKECKMLTSIPMLPPRLQYFDAHGCVSLERVANPLALPVLSEQIHATFNFSNCNNLDQDAKDSIISYIRWKSELVLDALSQHKEGYDLEDFTGTCFPGWKIPAWFNHQASRSVLETKLPPHWCDNRFTGIALCAVIQFPSYHKQMNHLLVKCNCVFSYEDGSHIHFNCTFGRWSKPSNTPVKTESSHVFIGYTSMLDIKKHHEEEDEKGCSCRGSFEFQLTDRTEMLENCEVLECGFRLIYETDERESISWDAKTVNVSGEAQSYGNSGSNDDIQYKSYSCLTMGRAESFFSKVKSDATPNLQKSFENKRDDLLNEENDAIREIIVSSYRDNTSSGNLKELNMHLLVGFELRLKQMEKVLYSTPGKTRIVGVVGMPGIGKTTLAAILFEKRGCKFPSHLFLTMSEKYSLERLRSVFLKELLKHVNQDIDDQTTHDSVKDKLLQTKVFVVLDDVSDKKQLEFLLGNLNWIKKGSKIVITTRDKSLLEGLAHDTYVVQQLNNREAFQLFTYYAFCNQMCLSESLLSLSRMFVDSVPGNPLDLKLLGNDLCGKGEADWQHELRRVRQDFNTKMRDVWRFSIDQLNKRQRDVFLDIVYFFKSEEEYFVKSILDSGNLEDVSDIRDLANKFLITISCGRVEMHDQMYKLGEELGSPKQHRLCNYKDIINKVTKIRQLEANNVRGIFLDMSEVKESIALECMTFTDMRNLLYLKIYDSSCPRECKADCNLYFPDGLEFPLEEVRYLHWVKFPLEELPPQFRPKNLIDLRLPYSKIKRVWEGVKDTPRLKWIDLSHSSKLIDLSALSKAENLQRLNLEGCTSLDELLVEIQNMKSLVFLNLRGCIRLCYLPKMNLISLKTLILSDCSNLKEFQLISESVEFLHLDGTAIEGLPPAIKNLHRLVVLNLKNCKRLQCLPNCLGELKFLDELILSGCSRLNSLPDVRHSLKHLQILLLDGTGANEMPNISCFTRSEGSASADISVQPFGLYSTVREYACGVNGVSLLRRLILSGNYFVTLQPDIEKLYNLNWLDVKQCTKLIFVPTLPPRLQYFDAHGCDSLERVANPLALPVLSEQNHATFIFSNCNKLDQDSKDSIMSYTRWRSQLMLDELTRYDEGSILEAFTGTCFPGWEVPAWFSHRAFGPVLKPKLPLHWSDNMFIGIALCAVISFHGYHEQRNRLIVNCNCVFNNEDGSHIPFSCTIGRVSESSDTPGKIEPCVFIGYTSILDIKKLVEEDEEGCSHTKASLEFKVTDGTEVLEGCEVLKCGFSLIYATDELRVKSGVRGELFEVNHDRAYSKNAISDVRREAKAAERSPDGGDKATSSQPPNAKSHVSSAEYGTTSNNSGRNRHIQALDVDARLCGEPQHHSDDVIPMVASSSQAGIRQSHSQVFVSYHGAELRKTFVKHLVSTLTDAGVNVFTDKDKGNEIKQLTHLYQRIEESKIALVIFSKRYVESNFCLNELVMMDELAKEGKLLVIPVFYNVRSSHVRNLNGEFGRRFKEMKERYKDELVKVMKWETSVKSIAKTIGIQSEVYGEDAPLVEATVETVQMALTTISEGNSKYLGSANTVIDHVFVFFVAFLSCLFTLFTSPLLYFDPSNFPSGLWLVYIIVLMVALAFNKKFAAGKTRRNNLLRLHHHHL